MQVPLRRRLQRLERDGPHPRSHHGNGLCTRVPVRLRLGERRAPPKPDLGLAEAASADWAAGTSL